MTGAEAGHTETRHTETRHTETRHTEAGNAEAGHTEPSIASLPPLRRNVAFQLLWTGTSAATLGVSVADIAYPLVILAVTRSPALAGLFAATQGLGMLLAGLPAGVLADRYDSRVIVIVTEAVRAAVTAVVVTALVAGWVPVPLLFAAAALLGAGQAIRGPAALLLTRSVVPPEQLARALTQDEIRVNGAALAGPALGGALYALRALGHAVPFLVTAGSFVIAVITTALTKAPARGGATRDGRAGRGSMLAGVRALWDQPVLRAATLLIMVVNTIGAGLDLVVIVILRHQAVRPGLIGLALGAGAAGGLAGAPLVRTLHRLRPGLLLLAVCALDGVILALLAVPAGPWWVAGLLFTAMLGVPAVRVLIDILVIRQAPPGQRGRVVAALMTLIGLGAPAGVAGCGFLLQYLPAQAAMLTLAAAELLVVAFCSARREFWQARWPGVTAPGAGPATVRR